MKTPSTINWLHLSDFHIGNPKYGWDSSRRFRSLFKDLEWFRDEAEIRPDMIFITGDLAYGMVDDKFPIKKQYAESNSLIESIRNVFIPPVSKRSLFFVPGNHDVNRKKIGSDQTSYINECDDCNEINEMIINSSEQWIRNMDRLSDYRKFLAKYKYRHLLQNQNKLSFTKEIKLNDVKVSISGINTAWSSSGDREKGKLWLGQVQFYSAEINQAIHARINQAVGSHEDQYNTPQREAYPAWH